MDAAKLAFENEILRGEVGSTAHGTGHEGQEDRDEMGVCIEPPAYVCGLSKFEQYIHRTQPEGVRSGPGDVDLVIYSLRKFCRLARQGNPSILVLLWLPKHIIKTDLGGELLGMRQCFFSREAGERFLGYLVSQKKALTGERAPKVARPELVERFGYDTKFAMHALRLGFQGIEYLTERRISEPVREPDRTTLLAVRRGEVGFAEALRLIENAEARLRALVNECTARAGNEQIDRFLIRAHYTHWLYKSGG